MFTDFLTFFHSLNQHQVFFFYLFVAFVMFLLYTTLCIIFNKGICPLPKPFMFGFWGSAPLPFLIYVAIDYRNHKALLAHEGCHQDQQRRDGLLTFWWKYITSKQARQDYEVEAYRVWVQVAPDDLRSCVWVLTKSYGFDLTESKARELLLAK